MKIPSAKMILGMTILFGLTVSGIGQLNHLGHLQPGNWSVVTQLPVGTTAFSLSEWNGKMYVVGGESFGTSSSLLSDVQIYDFEENTWSKGEDMPIPRTLSNGALVDGKIYAIGGHRAIPRVATDKVKVYDIENDTWDYAPSAPTARLWPYASVVDGKIYIMGGFREYIQHEDSIMHVYKLVDRFDPVLGIWDTVAPLPTASMVSSCVLNGKIYAMGGSLGGFTELSNALHVYNPQTDQWTEKASMNYLRGEFALAVQEDKIYAFGGAKGTWGADYYNHYEVYDPATDQWTPGTEPVPGSGRAAGCAISYNGAIYLVGGCTSSPHTNLLNVLQLNVPVLNILSKPVISSAENLLSDIHEDCSVYIVPQTTPVHLDSILKDSIRSYELSMGSGQLISLEGFAFGIYRLYAVNNNYDRVDKNWYQCQLVDEVPEFRIQVIDSLFGDVLIGSKIHLHGKSFVQDNTDGVDFTGWAWDSCSFHISHGNYQDFDTTLVVRSDTTLVVKLKYALAEADLHMYNEPLIEKTGFLELMMNQSGMIYICPENTPAKADSITSRAIDSFLARADKVSEKPLNGFPPGKYKIYGISRTNRLAITSYDIQVIDHFPQCLIEVRDAASNDLVDSCLLVVNERDTIPDDRGVFDLTGYYDTCTVSISRESYAEFDTTLIVLKDTSYVIYLEYIVNIEEMIVQEIGIYPNPTSDLVFIQTRQQGDYSLEILSLGGQVLHKMNASCNAVQLDLSSYVSGVYIVRILSIDTATTGRIIKF